MPLDIGGSLYCYKGSGQCNNYHGREDCAERWSYSSSPEESWSVTLCSESHFWICEKVSITKTQSHTVQLKFNRSELLPYRKWHLCHLTWVFIMLKLLSNPNVANIKLCWLLGLKMVSHTNQSQLTHVSPCGMAICVRLYTQSDMISENTLWSMSESNVYHMVHL